jgi:hypothetical protein
MFRSQPSRWLSARDKRETSIAAAVPGGHRLARPRTGAPPSRAKPPATCPDRPGLFPLPRPPSGRPRAPGRRGGGPARRPRGPGSHYTPPGGPDGHLGADARYAPGGPGGRSPRWLQAPFIPSADRRTDLYVIARHIRSLAILRGSRDVVLSFYLDRTFYPPERADHRGGADLTAERNIATTLTRLVADGGGRGGDAMSPGDAAARSRRRRRRGTPRGPAWQRRWRPWRPGTTPGPGRAARRAVSAL